MLHRHERALLTKSTSVRRAPLHFALGAGGVLALPFTIPFVAVSPLLGLGVFAGSFFAGATVGAFVGAASPRWLLGKTERAGLDVELRRFAEEGLPIEVASALGMEEPGLETRAGLLRGTPLPSPFGPEPVLAARLVGKLGMQQLDDAWIAPGPFTLAAAGPRVAEADLETHILLEAGAWLDSPATEPLPVDDLGPDFDEFLEARGVRVAADGSTLGRGELKVAYLRADTFVRVTGRTALRKVADGYRGTREAVDLTGPLSLAW